MHISFLRVNITVEGKHGYNPNIVRRFPWDERCDSRRGRRPSFPSCLDVVEDWESSFGCDVRVERCRNGVAMAKGGVTILTEILSKYPKSDRGFLIPILQEVQQSRGYVSPDAVDEIGAFTGVSPGEIFGVASFYSHFRFTKPGKHIIKVCRGTACHVRGSGRILEMIERELKVKAGETTADGLFSLERIACFGCCALAPVVVMDRDVHGRMSSTRARKLLTQYKGGEG